MPGFDRRRFLQNSLVSTAASGFLRLADTASASDSMDGVLIARAIGVVSTPRFYRHDIGQAARRMHEPTAGTDGNTGAWGEPIPVPGYREWFGYISGGWHFRGKLYMCHSTWTGGHKSIDGEPHHFIGSWTVFDPATHEFSRLEIPARDGEQLKYLMSDYCAVADNHQFFLAVNMKPPRTVIVLQSKQLDE